MENNLPALLTGFRKNHSTQHCLVSMIENWKNTLNKGGFVGGNIRGPLKGLLLTEP